MDPVNRHLQALVTTGTISAKKATGPAAPPPKAQSAQQPGEGYEADDGDHVPSLGLLLPSRGVAWAFAAQLSGNTWSWIKKIYPECEDNDSEAESCLYSALGELAPPAFEHSNRVGQLATRFAQFLGLSQPERRNLARAARFKENGFVALQMHLWTEEEKEEAAEAISLGGAFHDIGKIAVSRDILNKPGPLDAEERRLIELHPLIGEALLSHIPSARPLLPIVRHHHEKWDGTGYVDGLAGESIPWQARIIAIVDSFDAMTEVRPYRGPLSDEQACNEILRDRGKHFDPDLANKFVAMHGFPVPPMEKAAD